VRNAQLVNMSKRSAALEGRLRETSAREGQLRSALQHSASGSLPPVNGELIVVSLAGPQFHADACM